MGRYVLIDADGNPVNTIVWDGEMDFTLGDGESLIPESDYVWPEVAVESE